MFKKLSFLIFCFLIASCQKDEDVVENVELTSNLNCVDIPWKENINYSSVSDVDGNTYRTINMGNQKWMAENLKVTHYNNGDAILFTPSLIENDSSWKNLNTGSYSWYVKESSNGEMISYEECYGALYNWYVVNDDRKLCPTGWHVPTEQDWNTLSDYLVVNNYSDLEGLALKSTGGWNGYDTNTNYYYLLENGIDDFGFRALPSGRRMNNGELAGFQDYTYWWSSTQISDNDAWFYSINSFSDELFKCNLQSFDNLQNDTNLRINNFGFSVRCVQD